MDKESLLALAAEVEALRAPSKATDRKIALHFGWHRVEPRHTRTKHGGWIAPQDWIGTLSDGSPILDSLHGTEIHRDPPVYTASIDAALALMREVLPGWRVQLFTDGTDATASVWPDEGRDSPQYHGIAPTLPLSIVAAMLRAVAEREG